jgi:hypothetical protein
MLPENYRHLEIFDLEDAARGLLENEDPEWRAIAARLLKEIEARRAEEQAKSDEAYRRRHDPVAEQQRIGESKL